jgi:hypothetical protein
MPYLRKRDTGAVTDYLENDSAEYLTLVEMRFQSDTTAAGAPAGVTTGLISGETPGVIKAGQPVWESISEEDAGFPDPPGGRVGVIAVGSAATASAETSTDLWNAEVGGSLTDVEYVPNGGITGQATNNRVVTLQQVTISGTTSPTRTVTALASVTFGNGVNGVQNVPVPMSISQASFASGSPLQVVSSVNGTGLADPGGVVYFVYTRA